MNIDDIVISGHNIEATEAMRDLIHKKFERLLKHYGRFITDAEVILKIANEHDNIAEINVNVPDKQLNASAKTGDMYKSIDDMLDKLKTQLEKYKEIHFGHTKEERFTQEVDDDEDEAESLSAS
jgi:putative sigma-54 modulation protein